MPHHTKKKKHGHHSFVQHSMTSQPTIRNHGFRIKSRHVSSSRHPVSVKTIHRSIRNLIRRNNQASAVRMNVPVQLRQSLARSAKSKHMSHRQEEKLHKQMMNTIKKAKKNEKKVHEQQMNKLNEMMKSMGF